MTTVLSEASECECKTAAIVLVTVAGQYVAMTVQCTCTSSN